MLLSAVSIDYSYHYSHYPKVFVAPRAPVGFSVDSIDGNLDKPCWQNVSWSDPFDDIRGPDDAPSSANKDRPTTKTRVKMMWDDSYLYIGALLEREPQMPTPATFTDRNSPIYQRDSDFEVFIDIPGSCHRYKEFEVNAINTVWNLMLDKPYMDGGHEHSGRVAKEGEDDFYEVYQQTSSTRVIQGKLNDPYEGATWSVELAMAYTDLMNDVHLLTTTTMNSNTQPLEMVIPPSKSHWRINFSRVEKQGDINWTWQPQIVWDAQLHRYRGMVNMHLPDAWGYVVFHDDDSSVSPIVKDTSWPLRMAGMSLYYAQHEYKSRYGVFAERIEQVIDLMDQSAVSPFHVEIMLKGSGFEIIVQEKSCGWEVSVTDDRLVSATLHG